MQTLRIVFRIFFGGKLLRPEIRDSWETYVHQTFHQTSYQRFKDDTSQCAVNMLGLLNPRRHRCYASCVLVTQYTRLFPTHEFRHYT